MIQCVKFRKEVKYCPNHRCIYANVEDGFCEYDDATKDLSEEERFILNEDEENDREYKRITR